MATGAVASAAGDGSVVVKPPPDFASLHPDYKLRYKLTAAG